MPAGFNQTPSGERTHIAFFGRRNAGKSSVVNAVTGQPVSIVSDVRGTTTDPVFKSMELLPLGPVVIIDTPGLDDSGEVGEKRVRRARQVLNKADAAVLVVDASIGMQAEDYEILGLIQKKGLPVLIAYNKSDLLLDGACSRAESADETQTANATLTQPASGAVTADSASSASIVTAGSASSVCLAAADSSSLVCSIATVPASPCPGNLPSSGASGVPSIPCLSVSAKTGAGIASLKETLAAIARPAANPRRLVGDLLAPGDLVVLVTPIDAAAPKGRMILPQVQMIRDILDADAVCSVTQPNRLPEVLAGLKTPPRLVITDSQAFGTVKEMVPETIPLTSFSILFARYKGVLMGTVQGARALETLKDGDTVLISEGCTHRRQCGDIGTEKLPRWITAHTGKKLQFEFSSGGGFPEELSPYALVVHCGGCMLNEREMRFRQGFAADCGVPYTNYGVLISYLNGILPRALAMLPGFHD